MSAILSIVYCTKTVFICFLAYDYVLHCVHNGLSVDCFNKNYHLNLLGFSLQVFQLKLS